MSDSFLWSLAAVGVSTAAFFAYKWREPLVSRAIDTYVETRWALGSMWTWDIKRGERMLSEFLGTGKGTGKDAGDGTGTPDTSADKPIPTEEPKIRAVLVRHHETHKIYRVEDPKMEAYFEGSDRDDLSIEEAVFLTCDESLPDLTGTTRDTLGSIILLPSPHTELSEEETNTFKRYIKMSLGPHGTCTPPTLEQLAVIEDLREIVPKLKKVIIYLEDSMDEYVLLNV